MAGPEISRDYLPHFERYLRDTGVSQRHEEFFRHVFVELGAFLDANVVEAPPEALDDFLSAKIEAGLSERRQRAYGHVLERIRAFQSSLRVARRQSSGAIARVSSSDALDSQDFLQGGLGFHAAGVLDETAPAELPGESTRAINDAPLLARSAMATSARVEDTARKRSVFDPGGRPRSGRQQRLASLDHGRYDDDDDFYDRLAGDRSSTAIPDFMDAAAGAHDDDDDDALFDPLDDADGPVDELATFDHDLPVESLYEHAASSERGRHALFDDLPAAPAAHRASDLPAPAGAQRGRRSPARALAGDATPVPDPHQRGHLGAATDDLPAAAAPWARGSSTREVGGGELPAARSGHDLPATRSGHDLPAMRAPALERPGSEPTRVARPTSAPRAPRSPLDVGHNAPAPQRPVSTSDPLDLFGDLDLPSGGGRADPLNPPPAAASPSALFAANPPPEAGPRNHAALFQASATGNVESPFGPRGATLASHQTPAAAGFERGATLRGVGAVNKQGQASGQAAPPARPVTAAPVGGAVAFSKLGMLEPSEGGGSIEVADDDEAPQAAASAASPASSGPSLRAVDVPTDAVRNAKPIPGAEAVSREDAVRRARKRLSKTIEKASSDQQQEAPSRGRGKRFRPFVYDGRFLVDRPAPQSDDCMLVAPGPESGAGPVLKLALVPLMLTLSGLALLIVGVTAGLGLGPLAALGVAGWGVAAVGALLAALIGAPTARWLQLGLKPLQRNTPDAALRSYHTALWVGNYPLARRCLALGPDAAQLPDDFDVRQKRCIEEAFNRLDEKAFARYWFIQHPQARESGLRIFMQRGRAADVGETRLVAGSVDAGEVLLLVEMRDAQHYWLVPMVRIEGLWYLADGQLFWRNVKDANP